MSRRTAAATFVGALLAAPGLASAEELEGPTEEELAEETREGSGRDVQGAKSLGLHTPRGRAIYRPDQLFSDIVDSRRRIFVIEAAAGLGPEGNLGLVFGYMPKQIHGIEFYGGVGAEANPAYRVTGAVRLLFNIKGYRPYFGAGYIYKDAYAIGTFSHNGFLEAGYSLKLKSTNHLTLGLGISRLAYAGVRASSALRGPEVDAASLEEQIKRIPPYQPLFVVRVSHAF
jgi:hypothetical protein